MPPESFTTRHVILPKARNVRFILPWGARVLGVYTFVSDEALEILREQAYRQPHLNPDDTDWGCPEIPVMFFYYRVGEKKVQYRAFQLILNGSDTDPVPIMAVGSFALFGGKGIMHVFEVPDDPANRPTFDPP
jgi:hypothetical protein